MSEKEQESDRFTLLSALPEGALYRMLLDA